MKRKVSQSQLILPLLDAIEERGGAAKARDINDLLAEKVDFPAEERTARITVSGHSYGAFGNDNGGAIPGNLIVAANTESNSDYIRSVKAAGLPVHPARFPAALPEMFIKFLTRPKDLVFEPFGGSLTTAAVAEALDRRWIASECMLEYLKGGQMRFPSALAA